MNIAELLFGLGGAAIGSVVSVFVQRLVTHKKTKTASMPSVIAAPVWAKTTDPIPVLASIGKPHQNCPFCNAVWRKRAFGKTPAEVGPRRWEGVDENYGGPTWPKVNQGFAIQYCTDCGAHWAYTVVSEDAIAEIRAGATEKKRVVDDRSDEERAWEEVEESLRAKSSSS